MRLLSHSWQLLAIRMLAFIFHCNRAYVTALNTCIIVHRCQVQRASVVDMFKNSEDNECVALTVLCPLIIKWHCRGHG